MRSNGKQGARLLWTGSTCRFAHAPGSRLFASARHCRASIALEPLLRVPAYETVRCRVYLTVARIAGHSHEPGTAVLRPPRRYPYSCHVRAMTTMSRTV